MAKKRSVFRVGTERTEEETLTAAQAWWKQRWPAIIGGLALGITGVGGWYGWQNYVENRRQTASEIYLDLVRQEDSVESVKLLAQLENYPGTVYLSLGKMQRTRTLVEEGDLEKAAEYLQWVIDHSPQSAMVLLAEYRLLRVFLAQGKYQEVFDILQEYNYSIAAESYFLELKGDALVGLGRYNEAVSEYRKALSDNPNPTALLRMKLDNLGG